MQFKRKEIVQVKIEKLAFGGRGIGQLLESRHSILDSSNLKEQDSRQAGMTMKIFVDNVVPGDIVVASLQKIKKNYAEAKLEKVLEPSNLRIKPKCIHFEKCGGCSWQYLSYEDQLKFKESQVKEILKHTGNFQNAEDLVLPIIGCQDIWFYRNKMEFSFGDDESRYFALGLHMPGKIWDLINITDCLLESEIANKIVIAIRDFAISKNLYFFNARTNEGLLRNLMIKQTKNTDQIMVNLICSAEKFDYEKEFVELVRNIDEKICSIYLTNVVTRRGERTRSEEKLLWGKEEIEEEMNIVVSGQWSVVSTEKQFKIQNLKFKISPKSFFQPNTKQAEVLYSKVLEFADLKGDDIIYDLYCGTGTIGMILSKFAKKVYGIELIEDAVEDGRKNAALNNCKNIEFLCGDAGKLIPEIPEKPDLIIVDPPRAGLSEKSVQNILDAFHNGTVETGFKPVSTTVPKLPTKKLIYVSCNPTTLARDLKIFCDNGFTLIKVQPVDMFPHTYHIENIALLEKDKIS